MHKLYELKDRLIAELEEMRDKSLSDSSLKSIDTLAHAAKNIAKVIECCEDEEYSMGMGGYSRRGGYSMDESYADDGSYGYDGRDSYIRPDGSYANHSYARGRGRGAKRDSMGRYSRAEDMRMQLEQLMNRAKDESTKKEVKKILERM